MTEQDWFELEREYIEVFGSNIPRMMLPSDQDAAAALVKEAIETRDEAIFERDIPVNAAI